MRDMTPDELARMYPQYRCSFCGCTNLIGGPRGGIMQNCRCTKCGATFNLVAPDSNFIARDKRGSAHVPPIGQVINEPPAVLSIWTIYKRPADFPQGFIARRFELDKPTSDTRTAFTIDEIRSLIPPGLYRIPRHANDDPCIVEVWI
jgi:hypothetical protein